MENLQYVYLLIRTVTGTLFFFQGYDKIFNVKVINVVNVFEDLQKRFSIGQHSLKLLIYISSWIEIIGGAFLFLGIFKFYVLAILSVNLFVVALTFSAMNPMWDMQYYFPRIIFIIILWLIPFSDDRISFDHLLFPTTNFIHFTFYLLTY